ncbi:hypothetical protein BK703_16680 [Bacillus thuringiensis serovar silo]|uniref:hypothetical protein n=1 Tax=Bacillus thuringiensis TaxID=1428 RepID=UPI000A3C5280|nr:hypothetical protein [Bacillus thuringiensis]MED3275437.1 hypothetical protein [Bacillus thuringiensis]OTW55273.1 hypothetical protein BK703_16680 [Bacillus thuringiensis serovar silo]OTW74295.1 hypothetical protein BK700_01365 [Bacillus thuringiensis serovar toguchini]
MAVVLFISGDGDYANVMFEEKYNAQEVYESMVRDGVVKRSLLDDYDELGIHVEIQEFGDVDVAFTSALYNHFILDEDITKHNNFHFVEKIEE